MPGRCARSSAELAGNPPVSLHEPTVFTTASDQAAKDSGLIQRRRTITGAGFVQTLVFGWLDDPKATIDDLGDELGVSKQGLDQRLDARAADGLWRVVTTATQQLVAASPETIPLLRRFSRVVIDDCTSLGLPAELAEKFPGCGGSDPEAGQAGLKRLVRFEVTTGQFQALERGAARDSSARGSGAGPPCRREPCTWPIWASLTTTSWPRSRSREARG